MACYCSVRETCTPDYVIASALSVCGSKSTPGGSKSTQTPYLRLSPRRVHGSAALCSASSVPWPRASPKCTPTKFFGRVPKKKKSPTGFVLVANHTPNDQRTTTARIIFVVNALRSAPKSRAASSGDRPDSRRPCARTPALLECNWAVLETPPLAKF